MPIVDHFEPIEKIHISGPAVDNHNNRKESDDYTPMTQEQLDKNYNRVREENLTSLKFLGSRS